MTKNVATRRPLPPFNCFSLAVLLFVIIFAPAVSPQQKSTIQSVGLFLNYRVEPASAVLVQTLATHPLRNLMDTSAVLVFFSSDTESLYRRGDSAYLGPGQNALGASLTTPLEIDALLDTTSLVPQSPAWEPLVYDSVLIQLTPFTDRRRNPSTSTEIAWLHKSLTSQSYCCIDDAAVVLW